MHSVPYFFVGDEAFPLDPNILRPFSRRELINNAHKIFNVRCLRARISVECTFGMLTTKFGILQTLIRCNSAKVDLLIQVMDVLHNAIKECDDTFSWPQFENVIPMPLTQNAKYLKT